MFLNFRTDGSEQTVQTMLLSDQTAPEEQSDHGLHCLAILLALFGHITVQQIHIVQFLEWLQQCFRVSKFLGVLRYIFFLQTYIGDVLISVNPYKDIPLYGEEVRELWTFYESWIV